MKIESLSFREPEFAIETTLTEGRLRLTLAGTADVRAIEPLGRLLPKIYDHSAAGSIDDVTVDVLTLEFMNSSCFKAFVTWISVMQDAPDRRYRITFVSNPAMRWQRRSLQALACFAPDMIAVTTGAP